MEYRRKKKRQHHWRKQRYGKYLRKIKEDEKRKEARSEFTFVLKQYRDKQLEAYWNNLITNVLPKMRLELEELGDVPVVIKSADVMRYAVHFFDIVSRYQDSFGKRKMITFSPASKEAVVDKFNGNMYLAGRHTPFEKFNAGVGDVPHWNQSKYGMPVTEHNVFFGPEIGLPKQSAAYWMNLPKTNKVTLMVSKNLKKHYKETPKIWATDAIVKYGRVRAFCVAIRENILEAIDCMLAE